MTKRILQFEFIFPGHEKVDKGQGCVPKIHNRAYFFTNVDQLLLCCIIGNISHCQTIPIQRPEFMFLVPFPREMEKQVKGGTGL